MLVTVIGFTDVTIAYDDAYNSSIIIIIIIIIISFDNITWTIDTMLSL